MPYRNAVNIEELRAIAKRRLPRFVFDYVDGGSEDEISLRGNSDAFRRLRFRPRTLVDVSTRDLSTCLLGARSALPAVVGPTGLNGLCWRDGDMELARAASAAGLPFAMSTVSMSLVEDVARDLPLQVVDGLDHHEDGKRDDQEIDHGVDEEADVPGRGTGGLGGFQRRVLAFAQNHEDVREVDTPQQQPDRRHQDIAHEGSNDLAERGADHDTDRHVQHVATDDEFFEFFQH
jgi:hypothetical protein